MWTSLIAIIASVLEIAKEFLTWQVALTKIQARKLAYDIDQQQIQAGRDLLKKIDSANTAGDLVVASQLLDDAQANSLYVANVRSAIPDLSGANVGIGGGIPTGATSSGDPYDGSKPVAGTITSPTLTEPGTGTVAPASGVLVNVPAEPYSITGLATWFGLNPNGSNDTGDMSSDGRTDLKGAFGDATHNKTLIGLSIPIPIFRATIGSGDKVYKDVAARRYLFDVWCKTTSRHVTGVWLVDLGPNASLNRPLDMTYALGKLLGLSDNAICTWSVTDTTTGLLLPIKGWNFSTGKIA